MTVQLHIKWYCRGFVLWAVVSKSHGLERRIEEATTLIWVSCSGSMSRREVALAGHCRVVEKLLLSVHGRIYDCY